ncbi:protein WEAK CHLOROPLAST MOVEMENT UNDER BLUE LIGHT 1 [Ziziphus jujuba]|uniref:Protein WEAK CHLOROPLAST MOVEMENT UNDER BLUE LIGHT 1 n=1 Tax=Ziziphus jujuba TaxID=326968 RepID=A0ABM4A2U7_ZIZJJ|nr:protein WEAK CHLOROPLAST MOVEMENT UNDER BLUE LIGHT 1 [Ziziphus jujuba]
MGVVDTKPIESVQASLCLFEEKGDQKKNRPTAMDESEIERELEEVLKDLANSKVQIEAKDAAYMQALLNLENYKKTACEHSAMLKNTEIERDRYKNECGEAAIRIDELKSKMKEMKDQLLESVKIGEQLEHVMNELKASKEELLRSEMELAALKDSESKALKQVELIEMDAKMDKQKVEELLKHVSELNDAILILEVAATEAEKEKFAMISEKDAQIQVAKMDIVQAQDQLKDMRKEVEMMEELENQFNAKCLYIEVLKSELKQEEEIRKSFEKDAADAINKSKLLKDEIDFKERKILSQEALIDAFKMELNQQKSELKNTNDLASKLSGEVEKLNNDIVKAKAEINEISGRETEAQVEIAMMKSEIHKGRSKIAAAEAAEARAESVKSGLYLAVQKLAVEAGSAKKENERLKQEADKADEETDSSNIVNPHLENPTEELDASQINDTDSHVTISMKKYESLIKKAEKEDSNWLLASQEKDEELEILKKELEAANGKIAEFRNRAVQAVSRAETAEKAKAQIEDQLRKWREHKQKRKAALAALRDVSVPKEDESIHTYSSLPRTYPQLGKDIVF